MALKVQIASTQWILREREAVSDMLSQESQDLVFPALAEIEWLNEHMQEVLSKTSFIDLGAFKTPGRLRAGKTPKTIFKSAFKTAKKVANYGFDLTNSEPGKWIQPIETMVEEVIVVPEDVVHQTIASSGLQAQYEIPELQEDLVEDVVDEVVDEQEEPSQPSPERSPVRHYTESDIGSPSVADTPEHQPARKGSFSFASLPPREPLKQSLGAPLSAIKQTATRQQSLGLDSDMSDDESVDLRAPELIAHEERMKAYESPVEPLSPPSAATFEPELVDDVVIDLPGLYPTIEPLEHIVRAPSPPARRKTRSSGKRKASEVEEDTNSSEETHDGVLQSTLNTTVGADVSSHPRGEQKDTAPPVRHSSVAPQSTRADRSRLRAPKPLGRPVRPTAAATRAKLQPQPVSIKIKTLAHAKPMNSAPVAAHNQDTARPESTQPELKKQTSIQSTTSNTTTFSKSISKAPLATPKVLSLAQKKKELDERAAAKDAAVKQQQRERRDNKIEELRRQKRDEEAERERKARENSAERRKKHLVDLDDREVKRQKSEERQEREQTVADAKKTAFRDMQEKRQIRPVTKAAAPRPQNPPPRPPARMDLHEDMWAEEDTPPRPAAPLRQPSLQRQQPDAELPPYPSNLSKPPVRLSNLSKKPSIFTSTHAGPSTLQNFPQPPRTAQQAPQMQHFANGRIPFATTPMTAQQQHAQYTRIPSAQVPGNNVPFAPMRSLQTVNETSPMSLPEIHTDSSDDSDRNVSLPSWATPGHVFNTLSQQETLNPDHIFPRIPTISMDDVFAENPDRLRRLRMRTSSANWIRTGDALTQVEVIEDRIGRQAIRNAGGWVYGGLNQLHGNVPSSANRNASGN